MRHNVGPSAPQERLPGVYYLRCGEWARDLMVFMKKMYRLDIEIPTDKDWKNQNLLEDSNDLTRLPTKN